MRRSRLIAAALATTLTLGTVATALAIVPGALHGAAHGAKPDSGAFHDAMRKLWEDHITWTNEDNFTHTVQVDGQADHKVERGESVSIAFETPGTYQYVCTLHSQDMEGEVIVR